MSDLRARLLSGSVSRSDAAVELASDVGLLVEEIRDFATSLEKAREDLAKGGGSAASLSGAALQISIARRIAEQASAEAGEVFDTVVWLAGEAAEVEGERPPG